MNQVLFFWIGLIFISVVGTLSHFLYDWTKRNKIIGLFAAVNESTWEHIKIALTPTILWSIIDGSFFGQNPNYFLAKIASVLVIVLFIPLVFYIYRHFFKLPILFVDINTFYFAIILSQLVFYLILNLPSQGFAIQYISAIACFVSFGAYMTLTLAPVKNIIFKDPITGKYGFRAHTKLQTKKK